MSLLCQLFIHSPSSSTNSSIPPVVTENEQENLLQACSESDSLISVRQIKRKYGEDVILSDCYCLSNCLFRISSKCNSKLIFKFQINNQIL